MTAAELARLAQAARQADQGPIAGEDEDDDTGWWAVLAVLAVPLVDWLAAKLIGVV